MDQNPSVKPPKRQLKRIQETRAIAEDIRTNTVEQKRTEALVTARAISLAGLPRRRTESRDLIRTLRLGKNLWVRVTYSTGPDGVLPYGEDRFVLFGIQHLALEQGRKIVLFDEIGQLLKMFGIERDRQSYGLLRDRIARVRKLTILQEFAETEQGLRDAPATDGGLAIEKSLLPTRKEIGTARIGQTPLPRLFDDPSGQVHRGVTLSNFLWEHLQDKKNHLLLRLDMLRKFVARPLGWDYYCFLAYRCRWAENWSPVPHEALMTLFKDAPIDQDSKTIRRLRAYHDEIMQATAGHLKAELRQARTFKTGKRGRPKERWELWVGPSEPIIHSGKTTGLFVPPEAAVQ